jgi:hypothetical protein
MERLITETLRTHLDWSEEDFQRLPKLMQAYASKDFFLRIYNNDKNSDAMFELYHCMLTYTQFHYY